MSLRNVIEHELNAHSAENGSDTPDFVLAEYLMDCLVVFDRAVKRREAWYSRECGAGKAILGVEQKGAVVKIEQAPGPRVTCPLSGFDPLRKSYACTSECALYSRDTGGCVIAAIGRSLSQRP